MTKEETIRTLQDIAWLGTEELTAKNVEAVSTAIACVNAIDYIKDYIKEHARCLETLTLNGYEVWKEVSTLMHVKAFIEGYEKGVFDDKG